MVGIIVDKISTMEEIDRLDVNVHFFIDGEFKIDYFSLPLVDGSIDRPSYLVDTLIKKGYVSEKDRDRKIKSLETSRLYGMLFY